MKLIGKLLIGTVCCIVPFSTSSAYELSSDSIYKHISVLAHDSLEGREVGEEGEMIAARYIMSQFQAAGLTPKGDNDSFLNSFGFIKSIDFGEKNRLTLNGVTLELNEEFMPLKKSANIEFNFDQVVAVGYGIKVKEEDGKYDDYEGKEVEGKAVLITRYSPSEDEFPHVNFDKYTSLNDKINMALEHNAAGVFFITPTDQDDTLMGIQPTHLTPKDIPIVFLRRKGLEKAGLDVEQPDIQTLAGEVELLKIRDTGYNVVGFLPGKTDTTVIIGAHFDHLGWGGPGSLYRGKEKLIHNGADDNASGTAALIELAKYYSDHRDHQKYSLLFIAFSGEEHGLLGSSHYAKNMTIDSSKVRMMVNMDMIGRLADQDDGLAIMGTGTCTAFKEYFDTLDTGELTVAFKESGTGPSDHTAFYNRSIPCLFFFTGAHSDYHKPSDDIETIDAEGIVRVSHLVASIVEHFDEYEGELIFQKTKDENEGKRRSQFSVTLGVMPDYVAEVKGLKIDGTTPDRPGERAGILAGDILIKMGDIDIADIYDYMTALGKFRKGDTCMVVVERGADTLSLQVVFE